MHLFSAIRYDSGTTALFRLDQLLSGSPHIGPLYVRSFVLVGVNYLPDILADSPLVSRILSQLPNLTHFEVDHDSARLLSHATAQRNLSLKDIHVLDNSLRWTSPAPREVTVMLASLWVVNIDEGSIDAMSAVLSAVDIRHLLSLSVESMASMVPSLRPTHRQSKKPGITSRMVIEPFGDMADTLRAFGNLSHFTLLKTISLQFHDGFSDGTEEWFELDAILALAGNTSMPMVTSTLAEQRGWRL
ncbi:hypothetical protein C8J57DRAFT_1468494 [Mycena rebaudengoi]|nr:hypothetical protein C8J57DRAFT_1468494 [Mycena rebaudengoi]